MPWITVVSILTMSGRISTRCCRPTSAAPASSRAIRTPRERRWSIAPVKRMVVVDGRVLRDLEHEAGRGHRGGEVGEGLRGGGCRRQVDRQEGVLLEAVQLLERCRGGQELKGLQEAELDGLFEPLTWRRDRPPGKARQGLVADDLAASSGRRRAGRRCEVPARSNVVLAQHLFDVDCRRHLLAARRGAYLCPL